MTITQQPASLSFVGNIPDFVVNTAETSVSFVLMLGADILIDEEYIPDNDGNVRIPVEFLIDEYLTISMPTADLYEQVLGAREFEATIDDGLADPAVITFTAIKGGVDRTSFDTLPFVKLNFLTWQPQTKILKWNDPNWLTYYAIAPVVVKAKGFFTGGTDETITLHEINTVGLWTMNLLYAQISESFASQPIYIDLWVESVEQDGDDPAFRSFTQRFLLTDEEFDFDDVFIFENSLGGIDTIRFTGEKKLVNANRFDVGIFYDNETFEYQVNPDKVFEKNTGYYPDKHTLKWSQDFFSSKQKYLDEIDEFARIVTKDPELIDIEHELIAFDFVYAFTEQTAYLDLVRVFNESQIIIVIGPGDELEFFDPRDFQFPTLTDPGEAVFLVRRPGENFFRQLTMQALLAYLYMNLCTEGGGGGGTVLPANILAALEGNGGTPGDDNRYVTEEGLATILESIDLPTGRRLISAELIVTSTTAGLLTAEWINQDGVTRTLTNAAVTFPGAPSTGNYRWEIIELFDDGSFSVNPQSPEATEPIRPTQTADTLVAAELIWDDAGVAQQPGNGGGGNVINEYSTLRFVTQGSPGTNGKYAKIWEGNLSRDNNYAIIIDYHGPKEITDGLGDAAGRLKASWTCDPSRNIVAKTVQLETDAGSAFGTFRLVQIAGNKAALYHLSPIFWGRIQFRVTFQNSSVRIQDFVGGTYGAAPSAVATYDSRPQYSKAYERESNTVLFNGDYIIGNAGARSGNILFDFAGAQVGATVSMDHQDASAFIYDTVATIRKYGADYDPAGLNVLDFQLRKLGSTIAGHIIDLTISQPEIL